MCDIVRNMHEENVKKTDPAFEYSKITNQVYIGTNSCCQTHFEESLLKQEVKADISLEGEQLDQPHGVDLYLWLPTPDHHPPELDKTLVGIAALKQLLENGQKAYIHCRNGHGRAPTFFAAYLIKEKGMTPDGAVDFIKEKRPSIHIEDNQREFLASLA